MGLFKKKPAKSEKSGESAPSKHAVQPGESATVSASEPQGQTGLAEIAVAESGPLDFSQLSDDQLSSYVDFGALLVPRLARLGVHPDGQIGDNAFGALTLRLGVAGAEVMVVAAPKSKGLWQELREEIETEARKQGAKVTTSQGSFGPEIHVQMSAQTAAGQSGNLQMRYVGIDGPNWFMRVIFTGDIDPHHADVAELEAALRHFVVVRGSQPLTPRSIVPIVLPDDLVKQLAQLQAQSA